MKDKKSCGIFKKWAWELWIRPFWAPIAFFIMWILAWLVYAIILNYFLTSDKVISGIPELIGELVKLTQTNGTKPASLPVMGVGIFLHIGLPLIFGGIWVAVWHSIVYPTNQKDFLARIKFFKANETKHLLRELLRKAETRLVQDFESARAGQQGARILLDKIKGFAQDYVDLTDATEIKMTTLYSPKELFSDAARQAAVRGLTTTILSKHKHLTRICIGEKKEFENSNEMGWFKNLHKPHYRDQKVEIFYVENSVAMATVADDIKSRADVLVLGGSVAFALRTHIKTDLDKASPSRLEVYPDVEKDVYTLFLLETDHDISEYERLFTALTGSAFRKETIQFEGAT